MNTLCIILVCLCIMHVGVSLINIYIAFFSLFTYYHNNIVCVNLNSNLEDHFCYLVFNDHGMNFINVTTYGTS